MWPWPWMPAVRRKVQAPKPTGGANTLQPTLSIWHPMQRIGFRKNFVLLLLIQLKWRVEWMVCIFFSGHRKSTLPILFSSSSLFEFYDARCCNVVGATIGKWVKKKRAAIFFVCLPCVKCQFGRLWKSDGLQKKIQEFIHNVELCLDLRYWRFDNTKQLMFTTFVCLLRSRAFYHLVQ
jgi:hypothetical protein